MGILDRLRSRAGRPADAESATMPAEASAGTSDVLAAVDSVAPRRAHWAELPPIQRTTTPLRLTAAPGFGGTLTSWRDPSFIGPPSHAVLDGAPSGLVQGLFTSSAGPSTGLERPALSLPVAAPDGYDEPAVTSAALPVPVRRTLPVAAAAPITRDPVGGPPAAEAPTVHSAPAVQRTREDQPVPEDRSLPAVQRIQQDRLVPAVQRAPGDQPPPAVQRPAVQRPAVQRPAVQRSAVQRRRDESHAGPGGAPARSGGAPASSDLPPVRPGPFPARGGETTSAPPPQGASTPRADRPGRAGLGAPRRGGDTTGRSVPEPPAAPRPATTASTDIVVSRAVTSAATPPASRGPRPPDSGSGDTVTPGTLPPGNAAHSPADGAPSTGGISDPGPGTGASGPTSAPNGPGTQTPASRPAAPRRRPLLGAPMYALPADAQTLSRTSPNAQHGLPGSARPKSSPHPPNTGVPAVQRRSEDAPSDGDARTANPPARTPEQPSSPVQLSPSSPSSSLVPESRPRNSPTLDPVRTRGDVAVSAAATPDPVRPSPSSPSSPSTKPGPERRNARPLERPLASARPLTLSLPTASLPAVQRRSAPRAVPLRSAGRSPAAGPDAGGTGGPPGPSPPDSSRSGASPPPSRTSVPGITASPGRGTASGSGHSGMTGQSIRTAGPTGAKSGISRARLGVSGHGAGSTAQVQRQVPARATWSAVSGGPGTPVPGHAPSATAGPGGVIPSRRPRGTQMSDAQYPPHASSTPRVHAVRHTVPPEAVGTAGARLTPAVPVQLSTVGSASFDASGSGSMAPRVRVPPVSAVAIPLQRAVASHAAEPPLSSVAVPLAAVPRTPAVAMPVQRGVAPQAAVPFRAGPASPSGVTSPAATPPSPPSRVSPPPAPRSQRTVRSEPDPGMVRRPESPGSPRNGDAPGPARSTGRGGGMDVAALTDGQLDELARLLSPRLWRLLRGELIRERERVGRVRDTRF
jgi:hypothetical protein